MSKGFVLTLDAIVAGVIIGLVVSSLTLSLPQAPGNVYILDRAVQDVAAVLDINGTISTRNQTLINATIKELLPANLKYEYRVEYWNISGSSLVFDRTLAESFIIPGNDTVYAVRPVPILANETQNIRVRNTTAIARFALGVSA